MRLTTLFCFLGLCVGQVFANSPIYLRPHVIEISGIGGFFKEKYSLRFVTKPSSEGIALDSIVLNMAYGEYISDEGSLTGVFNPEISRIMIVNDAGSNGTYYDFSLKYGDMLDCNEKMILHIHQPFERDSAELKIEKINPCDKNS